MTQFELFMLRDRKTGRWHRWGGLLEWAPADHLQGGTIWFDRVKAQEFADQYPKDVCDVEVVPLKAAR